MIWHLVGVLAAGLGAGGIAALLRAITRKRLPRWILPVFAGAGMMGYQVLYEYTWFEHRQTQLPPDTIVIDTYQHGSPWRPWTYVFPMTTGFTIVDTGNLRRSVRGEDDVVQFYLYRFEKQHVDTVMSQVFLLNCSSRELLDMRDGQVNDDMRLRRLEPANPLYSALCEG